VISPGTGTATDRFRPAERIALIDLDAIRNNVRRFIRVAAPARLMAVVKADAYGHGAIPVARAALEAGATWLGVAHIAEALALRDAGIDAPLLAWLHTPESDFSAAIAAGVDLGDRRGLPALWVPEEELQDVGVPVPGFRRGVCVVHVRTDQHEPDRTTVGGGTMEG